MDTYEVEQNRNYEPPMSDFMETDLAAPTTLDGVNPRQTRWIVFAGDELTPDYKRQVKEMRMGGKNLGHSFKSLGATKGFLRRCQLTPLTIGYDGVNAEILGEDKTGVVTLTQRGKAHDPWSAADAQKVFTSYAYEVLPGNDLASILAMQQGEADSGVREVEILRGVEPPKIENGRQTASKGRDYQYEIFPDWAQYLSGEKEFFKTAGQLAAYLIQRKRHVSAEAATIIDVLLDSNAAFERWATRELDKMSRLVKAPITEGGRAYGFEPVHVQFFDHLELNREEFLMKKSETPGVTNAPSLEEFNEMREMLKQLTGATLAIAKNSIREEKKVCAALKADESPCKAFAKDNSDFCAMHQPKGD